MMKSQNRINFTKGKEVQIRDTPVNVAELDGSDSIEDMFRQEQQANQDTVKELFHEDKVKARTDLSSRQIKLVTKAYLMAKLTGIKDIERVLLDFMTLSISKDRKSRAEYVQGLIARMQNDIERNAMNVRGQFGK